MTGPSAPVAGRSAGEPPTGSTALFTDHYELTMLEAALADGTADRACSFEVFARRLPPGRRYGVVAGTGRLIDAVTRFLFGEAEIARLEPVLDRRTIDYLAGYAFDGDIEGYREGELYFPGSPVLTVTGTFGAAATADSSWVRREPISINVRCPATDTIRAAADAIAQSWFRMDSASVSRITAAPKVPVTVSTGEPGKYSSPSRYPSMSPSKA